MQMVAVGRARVHTTQQHATMCETDLTLKLGPLLIPKEIRRAMLHGEKPTQKSSAFMSKIMKPASALTAANYLKDYQPSCSNSSAANAPVAKSR